MSASTSGRRPRLIVDNSFAINPDAQAAWESVSAALMRADDNLIDGTAWSSIGAPGSADKLRDAAELIDRAAAIIKAVGDDVEEEKRWRQYSLSNDS